MSLSNAVDEAVKEKIGDMAEINDNGYILYLQKGLSDIFLDQLGFSELLPRQKIKKKEAELKKDLEIKEIELEAFGKKGKVQVYEREGKYICIEASLLDFAYQVGLKNFQVKKVIVSEDLLWTDKGSIMTATKREIKRDGSNNIYEIKDEAGFVKGIRYTVLYQVETPDGQVIVDLGSAGADNVNLEFRRYVPEIASRRARVRTILTAINRKDLLADIEMPPDFLAEDKEIIERNKNGFCSPEQVSALKVIYKTGEKRKALLEKYKKKAFEDLTYEEAAQAIREGQRKLNLKSIICSVEV